MLQSETNLRRSGQRGANSQIPNRPVLDLGQILWDLDINDTHRLGNSISNLDLLIKMDGIEVANGVVVQPHAVIVARVFVQRVRAVRCWLAIEAQVNGLTSCHSRVVGDALVDVDAGVVTLAPCCFSVSIDIQLLPSSVE